MCYGWGGMSDYRFKIGDFAPTGAGWPRISGRRGRHTNHSCSQKIRLNGLSNGIKMHRSFNRFVTIHACDRQTDGQTDRILIARPRLHSMRLCIDVRAAVDSLTGSVYSDICCCYRAGGVYGVTNMTATTAFGEMSYF